MNEADVTLGAGDGLAANTSGRGELDLSAASSSRVDKLKRLVKKYAEKCVPREQQLLELGFRLAICDDDDLLTNHIKQAHDRMKNQVEETVTAFLKEELDSSDLASNLEKIDALELEFQEDSDSQPEKVAWRPTRTVEDTVKAYRIHEKRRHLLELKKELTLAEEQLDGVHQSIKTQQTEITKKSKAIEQQVAANEEKHEDNADRLCLEIRKHQTA